ncbi:hypothetical protein ACVTW2_000657 [Escherichia coli]
MTDIEFIYNINADDACFIEFIESLNNESGYSCYDFNIEFDNTEEDLNSFLNIFGNQFATTEVATNVYHDFVPVKAIMDSFEEEHPLTYKARMAVVEEFNRPVFDYSNVKVEID